MMNSKKSTFINLCTNCKYQFGKCGSKKIVFSGDLVKSLIPPHNNLVIKCEKYFPCTKDRD